MDDHSIPARPLDQLLQLLADAAHVLILPHNDPDPDAIASALGLRYLLGQRLGLDAQVAYQGIIGRAENKALVRYLGRPLRQLAEVDLRRATHLILVDTQSGAGNNPLPAGRIPAVIMDHHAWRAEIGPDALRGRAT
ncbi:MAG: DHH family phosphoesterase [Anaerolineae bacterium]